MSPSKKYVMKPIIISVLIIAIVSLSFTRKYGEGHFDKGGLYASSGDFLKHRLTYAFECSAKEGYIHFNGLLGADKGYVMVRGEKHPFSKESVYGYRDCQSHDYRIYLKRAYQILDTAGFYLYYQYEYEQPVYGKGMVKADHYYFSTTPESKLQRMTLENLKIAFAENTKFQYALDAGFRSDNDLISYDRYLHSYKIKYLFGQSIK